MKQIDRIRNMNADGLARFIDKILRNIDCDGCPCERDCLTSTDREHRTCVSIIAEWLESEVENANKR